jgi:hypothetical protein
MRTERQIQASRVNGAKSRGPITSQGKSNSSHNNFQHGLRAQLIFPDHESDPNWTALLAAYLHELQPHSELEQALVRSMALSVWRWTHLAKLEPPILDRAATGNFHPLELFNRVDSRCTREYFQAANSLRALRRNINGRTQQTTDNTRPHFKTKPSAAPDRARPAILKKLNQ